MGLGLELELGLVVSDEVPRYLSELPAVLCIKRIVAVLPPPIRVRVRVGILCIKRIVAVLPPPLSLNLRCLIEATIRGDVEGVFIRLQDSRIQDSRFKIQEFKI